jgi:hypothetical protein
LVIDKDTDGVKFFTDSNKSESVLSRVDEERDVLNLKEGGFARPA